MVHFYYLSCLLHYQVSVVGGGDLYQFVYELPHFSHDCVFVHVHLASGMAQMQNTDAIHIYVSVPASSWRLS